jgi:hypothetical protein
LSGFDRPRSTTGDAPLPSAFFERAVKILATAVSAVFFVRHWRLDHPPFLLGDREQLSTVAVGRLIGDVAVTRCLRDHDLVRAKLDLPTTAQERRKSGRSHPLAVRSTIRPTPDLSQKRPLSSARSSFLLGLEYPGIMNVRSIRSGSLLRLTRSIATSKTSSVPLFADISHGLRDALCDRRRYKLKLIMPPANSHSNRL